MRIVILHFKYKNMNISIKVANLKCRGCTNTIKKNIIKFKEVSNVEIDIENSLIIIEFSGNINNIEVYKSKLTRLGYPEVNNNNIFSVAKSFVSCATGRINN